MPVSQALALFVKIIAKISRKLTSIQKDAIAADMPGIQNQSNDNATSWTPVQTRLEDELNEAGDEATKALREKQKEMIDSLDLSR